MSDWNSVRYGIDCEEPLDEEIVPLRDALNAAGFETTDSCSGHGTRWPSVWFRHSTDERIEALARHVMLADSTRHFSSFKKEILPDGYRWSVTIHLTYVFGNTEPNEVMREAVAALALATQTVAEFNSHRSGDAL